MTIYLFINLLEDLLIFKQVVTDGDISYIELEHFEYQEVKSKCEVLDKNIFAYIFDNTIYQECSKISFTDQLLVFAKTNIKEEPNNLNFLKIDTLEKAKRRFVLGLKEIIMKDFSGLLSKNIKENLDSIILEKINGDYTNSIEITERVRFTKDEVSQIFFTSFEDIIQIVYSKLAIVKLPNPSIYLDDNTRLIKSIIFFSFEKFIARKNISNLGEIKFIYKLDDFLKGFTFDTRPKEEVEKEKEVEKLIKEISSLENENEFNSANAKIRLALALTKDENLKSELNIRIITNAAKQENIAKYNTLTKSITKAAAEYNISNWQDSEKYYKTAIKLATELQDNRLSDLQEKLTDVRSKLKNKQGGKTTDSQKQKLETLLTKADSYKNINSKKVEAVEYFTEALILAKKLNDTVKVKYISKEIKKLTSKPLNLKPLKYLLLLLFVSGGAYFAYNTFGFNGFFDTVTEINKTGYVIAKTDVNIRPDADLKGIPLTQKSRGDDLFTIEQQKKGKKSFKVIYNKEGDIGYISDLHFSLSKPEGIEYINKNGTVKKAISGRKNLDKNSERVYFKKGDKIKILYKNTKKNLIRVEGENGKAFLGENAVKTTSSFNDNAHKKDVSCCQEGSDLCDRCGNIDPANCPICGADGYFDRTNFYEMINK